MNELLKTTLIGLFFGTFGTTIGGVLGTKLKNTSNKYISFILSLAAGLMTAIVSFDLIPEAIQISSTAKVLIGITIGVACMMTSERLVDKKFNQNHKSNKEILSQNTKTNLLKTGIIISIGLAIHNFPEGLAIGSGFEASITLGYSLAIAICIHDIPEGISMAVPMKLGGMSSKRVIFYVILSGVTTGIGAFIGNIIGEISQNVIAMCLSFAAGAMLYIVAGELTPESNKLYSGKLSVIGNILGFVLGIIAMQIKI